jgi:hypothetical protein
VCTYIYIHTPILCNTVHFKGPIPRICTKFMRHTEYSYVSTAKSSGCTAVLGFLPSGLDSSMGELAKK